MTAVRACGLAKRFEQSRAVDGVSIELADGEVRGLLGPNGAGKTTLLRLLFGLVRADAGTIELFGRARDADDPLSLDGVAGFVEDPSFYPYLTGRANLELLAELDQEGAAARVSDSLERVALTERAEDRVSGYSTGMRQRLGIAAALLRAPRLLLLDEPIAGLDPVGARKIGALVRELSASGVAVLLSSHQIGEIEGICDSFTFMSRGAVVWEGAAADLRAQAPAGAYALATSDDERALTIAAAAPGVRAARTAKGELSMEIEGAALDRYVLALGQAGVAVRRLEQIASPLESMFFALTSEGSEEAGVHGAVAPA